MSVSEDSDAAADHGPARACRKVFAFDALRIGVHSENPSHLQWLEDFLVPWFARSRVEEADVEVALRSDPSRFADLVRRGATPVRIDTFVLDARTVRFPVCGSVGHELVVFDETSKVFYLIDRDRRHVEILSASGDRSARTALMRVVREVAMIHARRRGLLLHASCFALDGKGGVLILGAKGAGKTTLLLHALLDGAVQYVTNDRALVSEGPAGLVATGIPTIVNLRADSLAFFPRLSGRLAAHRGRHTDKLEEAPSTRQSADPVEPVVRGLSPAQFCSLAEAKPIAAAPAAVLLFPRITTRENGIQLRAMSDEEAFCRIKESRFGVFTSQRSPSPSAFELVLSVKAVGCASVPRCDDLTGRTRAFECLLGRDAYVEPPTNWLRRLSV
jgi:hypothetical protein